MPEGQLTHWSILVAPFGEDLPAAHLVQTVLPTVLLYVPAEHTMHDPPSGPENPALHLQPVLAVDPAID